MNNTKALPKLICLILAIAAVAAEPAERESGKRIEKRTESKHERESYVDQYVPLDKLPADFQRSPLFKHEGRDPRTGDELGETLRSHVAWQATVEGIRMQLIAQERAEILPKEAGVQTGERSGVGGNGRGKDSNEATGKRYYRSVYAELQAAERATLKAESQNRRILDAWKLAGSRDDLVIRYEQLKPVGIVVLTNGEGRVDRDAQLLPSQTIIVVWSKDRAGRPFIKRSSPGIDGVTIEALRRTSTLDAAKAEKIFAEELQEARRQEDRWQPLPPDPAEVWNLRPTERGNVIELYLARTEYRDWGHIGRLKDGKFPRVDFHRGDVLVSLKSVDTAGQSWLSRMQDHIDDLHSYDALVDGKPARLQLDVRVQPGGIASA